MPLDFYLVQVEGHMPVLQPACFCCFVVVSSRSTSLIQRPPIWIFRPLFLPVIHHFLCPLVDVFALVLFAHIVSQVIRFAGQAEPCIGAWIKVDDEICRVGAVLVFTA